MLNVGAARVTPVDLYLAVFAAVAPMTGTVGMRPEFLTVGGYLRCQITAASAARTTGDKCPGIVEIRRTIIVNGVALSGDSHTLPDGIAGAAASKAASSSAGNSVDVIIRSVTPILRVVSRIRLNRAPGRNACGTIDRILRIIRAVPGLACKTGSIHGTVTVTADKVTLISIDSGVGQVRCGNP